MNWGFVRARKFICSILASLVSWFGVLRQATRRLPARDSRSSWHSSRCLFRFTNQRERRCRVRLGHPLQLGWTRMRTSESDLPERAKGLAPFVGNAILFALTHGLITPDQRGHRRSSRRPRGLSRYVGDTTDEVRDCIDEAEFIGRWFGTAGTSATVMTLWGVAP